MTDLLRTTSLFPPIKVVPEPDVSDVFDDIPIEVIDDLWRLYEAVEDKGQTQLESEEADEMGQQANNIELSTETGTDKHFSGVATPPYLPSPEITPAAPRFNAAPGAFPDNNYNSQVIPRRGPRRAEPPPEPPPRAPRCSARLLLNQPFRPSRSPSPSMILQRTLQESTNKLP
jgi:hypothetical protein